MNDEDLLGVLKQEMLLTEARARGAEKAYKGFAISLAFSICPFNSGDRILISYKDETRVAYFDKILWSRHSFEDYEGPVLFGWFALKNGEKAKTYRGLCTPEMVKAGRVTRHR